MGIAIISLTLASNKAKQPIQPTLFRTTQDEGISSRRCSGCHSLCFRCALEGRQEVLGRPLEGWLEERPRGEVHGLRQRAAASVCAPLCAHACVHAEKGLSPERAS